MKNKKHKADVTAAREIQKVKLKSWRLVTLAGWSQPCLLCPGLGARKPFAKLSDSAHLSAWGPHVLGEQLWQALFTLLTNRSRAETWGSQQPVASGGALSSRLLLLPPLRGSLHGRILFDSSFKIEMHSWAASFMWRWVVGVYGPHTSEDLFFMWLSLAIKCEGNTRERESAHEEGSRPCFFFLLHPSQWREDKLRAWGCLAAGFGSELMWGDAKLEGPCGLLGGPEIWGTGSPCWLAW